MPQEMELMKEVRMNQNSKVVDQKTLSWQMLQSFLELKGPAELGDDSLFSIVNIEIVVIAALWKVRVS